MPPVTDSPPPTYRLTEEQVLLRDAVRTLADHVHGNGVLRLEAVVRPENERSIRVLERLGFTREGRLRRLLRYRDGRADAFIYSLLPGE